jgi:hypothetical protein
MPRSSCTSPRTLATGPRWWSLSGLITERTVWTALWTMSSDQTLVSPVEIEEHGAGLPVHPARLDGDPELGQLPGNPGEQARRELARTGETIRKRADETRADLTARSTRVQGLGTGTCTPTSRTAQRTSLIQAADAARSGLSAWYSTVTTFTS